MISAADLKKNLLLVAENDGDSYRARDPIIAVHKAFYDYAKRNTEHLWETFFEIHEDLIKELQNDWKKTWP